MRKKVLISFWILLPLMVVAQTKKMKFNESGEYKIVQFTDTHYNSSNPKADMVPETIKKVLDFEKPDLVIFTGDIVTDRQMKQAWEEITTPLVERQIPWTFTFGNHDGEHGVTKTEIYKIIKQIPYCIADYDNKRGALEGSNQVLSVQKKNSSNPGALIYCMDSQEYAQKKGVGKYGWFERSQIVWYQKESEKWKKRNNNEALPALAYFHIPLPEYEDAWNNKSINAVGSKNEKICSPVLNTGMCAAMLLQGDIMGTFVGHDHVNDYIADYYGIALAYGRFSGGKNTYGNLPRGARVVVLKEGERKFTTWIRQVDGGMVYKTRYPMSNSEEN